jgi:CRISPR-associated protein Csb1
VPSQANRIEAALEAARERLGLPELVVDLSNLPTLPVHLPQRLSSFRLPHRNGDAYLRDAQLDGVPFLKSEVRAALFSATSDQPAALFAWMPQALLFGFWQSHLGKKRQHTKLARSWVSEIVGYEPAATDVRTRVTKGDPLNLSIDVALEFDENDQTGWKLVDSARKGAKSKDSLAELGHGQVPADAGPAAVSFAEIEQQATASFASLRRVWCGDPDANASGRALLVAIGLAGHVNAFSRGFSLRSNCDLRPVRTTWTWLGATGDEALEPLTIDGANALVRECAERAEKAGLPVGSRWQHEPLMLTRQPRFADVIAKSWPLGDT